MMKKNIFLLLTLVTALLLLCTGCKKDFESINTDPNAVIGTNEDYAYLLTNAEITMSGNTDGNDYEDWRGNLIYASCMIQHLSSTTGYWDGDKYFNNPGYLSAYWDMDFGPQQNGSNPLQNTNSAPIQNIVEVVYHTKTDTARKNLYNIARIFKAFSFQRLTDMYGDIPYSQAGLGYISGITKPVYDKQQDIYTDLLNELDQAASGLDASAPASSGPGAADLIYGGDVTKWKKFAYSEMVRVAMRLSKVDPNTAATWVAKAAAGGTFAGNADNAIVAHQAAVPNGSSSQVGNGSGGVFVYNDASAAHLSETFVDYLKSTSDPRLSYLGTLFTGGPAVGAFGDTSWNKQLGQPNGYDTYDDATNISYAPNYPRIPAVSTADSATVYQNRYSYVNRYTFARTDAPTFFLTYGETQLLLAEAAQRGWVTGSSAASYFNSGVQGAMQQLGLQAGAGPSDAAINTYLTTNPLVAGSELEQINDQYWVASFMDETESWANWRRSGYPVLTPINYVGNATGGTIPRRYTYPTGEAGTNPVNYAAAVGRLSNGDKMTSRVWWDAQ